MQIKPVPSARLWLPTLPRKVILLEILERLFVAGFFYLFMVTNLRTFAANLDIRVVMLITGETLPLILITLRPFSSALSQKPIDWAAGLSGTIAPLLVVGDTQIHPLVPLMACLSIIIFGLFVQIAAKVALGMSFGLVAANRGVKSAGPYRFVRHPMYAGYMLTHVGLFLSMPSIRNALLYSLALSLQLVRIMREEAVLRQDVEYRALAERVRYRLLPGLF